MRNSCSVVQTGYTTPTLRFSVYTKPPRGCSVTYIYIYTYCAPFTAHTAAGIYTDPESYEIICMGNSHADSLRNTAHSIHTSSNKYIIMHVIYSGLFNTIVHAYQSVCHAAEFSLFLSPQSSLQVIVVPTPSPVPLNSTDLVAWTMLCDL